MIEIITHPIPRKRYSFGKEGVGFYSYDYPNERNQSEEEFIGEHTAQHGPLESVVSNRDSWYATFRKGQHVFKWDVLWTFRLGKAFNVVKDTFPPTWVGGDMTIYSSDIKGPAFQYGEDREAHLVVNPSPENAESVYASLNGRFGVGRGQNREEFYVKHSTLGCWFASPRGVLQDEDVRDAFDKFDFSHFGPLEQSIKRGLKLILADKGDSSHIGMFRYSDISENNRVPLVRDVLESRPPYMKVDQFIDYLLNKEDE